MADDEITMKEVTYELNVCSHTIYLWIKRGTFPEPKKSKRGSRNISFDRAEIDLWKEKCAIRYYKLKKGITPTSFKATMRQLYP